MSLLSLDSIVTCLADGEFHSGEEVGARLGVSRAAVWKKIQAAQEFGLNVKSVKGKGYFVPSGIHLLDCVAIEQMLQSQEHSAGVSLKLFTEIDSTNSYLMRAINEGGVHKRVCLAEKQSGGRGRRGRVWQSPYAQNLTMSIGWTFKSGVSALEGLSLAVGVAVVGALSEVVDIDCSLKWPNDLLVGDKKLGGVLVELAGDVNGDCSVVIGLGLNILMEDVAQVDQPWTSILMETGRLIDRNLVAAKVISHLAHLLHDYEMQTFSAYKDRWQKLNAHKDVEVVISTPARREVGLVLGVDKHGALKLMVDGQEKTFHGGEVSLRAII